MRNSEPFTTHGGGIDQTAVLGHPPEHRDWKPGDRCIAPYVDATARVEAFVSVDAGLYRPTYIGARVWLMKHVHVGHDAVICSGSELAPGVIVGGHVWIGWDVRVGIGAAIKPGVRIGSGARIGCGAVVVKDVPAGEVWAGNPARCLQHPNSPRADDFEHLVAS